MSPNSDQTQPDRLWGKATQYHFAFSAAGDAGEKGNFDSILNLKHFIQAVKFQWPTQKLVWPPNFLSFFCGPLQTLCEPLGGHMAHDENHCPSPSNKRFQEKPINM
jgi:hypothetical protein